MSDADSSADELVDIDFGHDGLVPAVAQDAETGEVLMLAFADREAVERTIESGTAHYYSRSREELWQKGKSSGHTQEIEEIRVDCDADAVLYIVEQEGGACHTGYHSCFHRKVTEGRPGAGDENTLPVETETVGEKVFDPDAVYDGEE
ncbi:phosphoribosyl-AMP cyclohydrolase [Halospeciosus flavus]|uniref:Phosphoribosyl-AMP cyclohydrolase n=1 Tax=Halospeciosus flavus TaxID=3032283 RepID=A0ABD5Z6Y5_9EURY|nr:phosphoribosyl-AMP cyclohydrolase [Halospeciosus flavus]